MKKKSHVKQKPLFKQESLFDEENCISQGDNAETSLDAFWDRLFRHIETHHTGVFMIETEGPLSDDYQIHYCYASSRKEAEVKFLTVYPFFEDCILEIAPTRLDPYQIARHIHFIGEDQYFAAKRKREQERQRNKQSENITPFSYSS